jgi:hypothetical protein
MKGFMRISSVLVFGLGLGLAGVGHAQLAFDTGTVARMQQLHGSLQERAFPEDCDLRYRGFRARNTMTLSERRADRARCREQARLRVESQVAARTPGSAPKPE